MVRPYMIGVKAHKRSKYALEAEEAVFLAVRSYFVHMTQVLVSEITYTAVTLHSRMIYHAIKGDWGRCPQQANAPMGTHRHCLLLLLQARARQPVAPCSVSNAQVTMRR